MISDCRGFQFESTDAYQHLMEHANLTWTDCRNLSSYRNILAASSVHLVIPEYSFGNNRTLEAMACECLVIEIRSNSSKSETLIKDGKNGLVADTTSAENITEKILAALLYPSFMAPLQKKARLSVMEKYPMDRFLEIFSDTILNTGSRSSPRFG